MLCREFFESLPDSGKEAKQRTKLIDERFPEGECQLEVVSEHSHGIVGDAEHVHRYVISPHHVDRDTGQILPVFFTDCSSIGLSCQRSPDEDASVAIQAQGQAMVDDWNGKNPDSDKPRQYLGVVSAKADHIRRMVGRADAPKAPDGYEKQMMAIYDSALAQDATHVDVCLMEQGRDRAKSKLARLELALVFTGAPVLS